MNLNDEVICDFLVTAEQKRINAVYLDLLAEFDRLCQKAHITWWLTAGSLLGAARHKGFIPWDDDVDIMLPRKDFDRLMDMTNAEFGAEEPYFLQNPVTDPGMVDMLARFRRSDTAFITDWNWEEAAQQEEGCPYNMGIDLSIFPLDNVPKSDRLLRLQARTGVALTSLMYRAYAPKSDGRPLRRIIARSAAALLGRRGMSRLCGLPYRIISKNRSGKVQIYGLRYSDWDTVFEEKSFDHTLRVPFEDLELPIPAGYDKVLRDAYGDWTRFPPEEKRHPPHGAIADASVPYEQVVRELRDGTRPLPEEWTS